VKLPKPSLIGMPEKFSEWRRGQDDAVCRILDSGKRFVALAMPTGSGKSLTYMAASLLSGRSAILTATKALQQQIHEDFEEIGAADIRGMGNYECELTKINRVIDKAGCGCDSGPCLSGFQCVHQPQGCTYFDAQRYAIKQQLMTTNYDYWMSVNGRERNTDNAAPPLGHRDMLVLDEAHEAFEQLAGFMAVEIGHWEIEGVLGKQFISGATLDEWKEWAGAVGKVAAKILMELDARIKVGAYEGRRDLSRRKELVGLARRLKAIETCKGQWVNEETRDRHGRRVIKFDPVWPGEYAETALFQGISKVVLTSATIRPKTLELLGIPEDQYEFIDFPSYFKADRRSVIHIPTCRVNHDIDPVVARMWVNKMDSIIRARLDRKGIIHTVSYKRADYLRRYSEFSSRFILNNDPMFRNTAEAVQHFRELKPSTGAIMVSPSVGTGFDFPGDDCRYQIIAKVPFPDSRSPVMQARQERDADYFAYITAQNLVQMAGRGMRSEDDWCETFIVDDNWQWFRSRYRNFMPTWFLGACRRSETVPEPAEQKGART